MTSDATPYVTHPTVKSLNLLPQDRIRPQRVQAWLTLDDGSSLCEPTGLDRLRLCWTEAAVRDVIVLDPATRFQAMLGIGGTLTDSDTWNLQRLSEADRAAAIEALVDPKAGAGFNLLRIAFGSTDWNRDWDFYTYCDDPDPSLANFSIRRDVERGQLAMIRQFLAANPDIRVLASVWGLPPWMKTNGRIMHGGFDSRYTDLYADYLVRCVEAYQRAGIRIDYITSQNEPGTADDRDTPATMWHWPQQRDITLALRERLDAAGVATKIWLFDHNFDMAQTYVKPMLDDPRIRPAIDSVAFHDYRGRVEELSVLKCQHPDVPFVLTERARLSLADHLRMIECFRHHVTGHISWTTVSDDRGGPHQHVGGHEMRPRGWDPLRSGSILTVPSVGPPRFVKSLRYYYHSHLSRFVQRGAVRISSNPVHYEVRQQRRLREP